MADRKKTTGASLALVGLTPLLVVFGFGVLACAGLLCIGGPCYRTGFRYGIWTGQCPRSDLRLTAQVSAYGVVRGAKEPAWIDVAPVAHWLDSDDRYAGERQANLWRGFDWELELRDADGNPVPGLEIDKKRKGGSGGVSVGVRVPDLPDGDYVLHVTVDAGFDEATVDAPLPLFAPAIVHAMTDRPLYRPGQTVLFRSAMLRRTDESPIEGRTGSWQVRDPLGNEVLLEKARSGPWGIAASSFPLDLDAPNGTWTVVWASGADRDQVTFDVRPFRLPRFSVEVSPTRSWFAIGQELIVEGKAAYSSGAPIADAPVVVTARIAQGPWPLPLAWEAPMTATTGPDGAFRVSYGLVPPDLMALAKVSVSAEVVEQAGERVSGGTTAVLSHESLAVQAVTELGDGLVEGFNNRAYLRVTTPDGRPVPDAHLLVKRPYDATDPGKEATTDVDGVAAVQIDPGAPVSVVTPAPPVRPRPITVRPVGVVRAEDFVGGGLDLEESRALDRILLEVGRCGERANGDHRPELAVRVTESGAVSAVVAGDGAVDRCVAGAVRGVRFGAGRLRSFALAFDVPDPRVPYLSVRSLGDDVPQVVPVFEEAIGEARPCVRSETRSASEVVDVHLSVRAGSTAIDVAFDPLDDSSAAALACVRRAVSGLRLPEPAASDALGVMRVSVARPDHRSAVADPQPRVSTAYELTVTATAGTERLGEGRVVLPVGAVPNLRLRAQPSLAHPGDEVQVEFVRGPSWVGDFPKKLKLWKGTSEVAESELVEKVVRFRIPDDADGFLHAEYAGARAVVFVSPAKPLTVALSTAKAVFAPGDEATLTVTTRHGDQPTQAGVTLVGVDAMLGQLAPLLGPDDFGRVMVRAEAQNPAFGAFDPKALALGQIRGENAAKAAVLRVTQLPMDPAGDTPASAHAASTFDPRATMIESFYRVLERAADRLAAWEKSAPRTEQLDAERMVRFWDEALDQLEDEGQSVADGYGRRLTLSVVPVDLLAQVDPRKLVSDATRMPEDAEDFVQYVQREVR